MAVLVSTDARFGHAYVASVVAQDGIEGGESIFVGMLMLSIL